MERLYNIMLNAELHWYRSIRSAIARTKKPITRNFGGSAVLPLLTAKVLIRIGNSAGAIRRFHLASEALTEATYPGSWGTRNRN